MSSIHQSAIFLILIWISNIQLQASGFEGFKEATAKANLLEKKVESIFDEIDTLSLSISKKGIKVWTKWEGDSLVVVSESRLVPYHPNEFRSILENFSETFPKVNRMCKNVTNLKKQGEVRKGVKSELKFPYPLSNRLMIHWQYTHLDKDQDEHLLMFSEDGNNELLEEFHTSEEKKRFVLGRTFLCAYWIKPVYNKNDTEEIVGSNIRYMFSGDTGGIVPKYLQDTLGPKTAFDSIQGLVKFVQSKKNNVFGVR